MDAKGGRSWKRFDRLSVAQFAERAGEHLSELNAIHPFREGNGRAQRAFLVVLAEQAGHKIDLQRIDPIAWNEASKQSFSTADPAPMREVILGSIVLHQPPPLKTQPPNGPR